MVTSGMSINPHHLMFERMKGKDPTRMAEKRQVSIVRHD
jgi:hypothetical protein